MATVLLAVPSKRATELDVAKPLQNLIASTYSTSDAPVNVAGPVQEFQRLRQAAVKSQDRTEAGYQAVASYYDQILLLEQKIPSAEVQIPFKWKDAFDKGSMFGGRINLTLPSLAYEKVAVLFNLGAAASSIAAEQNLTSDDGLQKAMKKLTVAAGVFGHLKDVTVGAIQQDPTPDLEPETLAVLADLMLAQAQEMVVQKSLIGKMKDVLIVKISAHAEEMFAGVMKRMQTETVRTIFDKSWLPNVSGKQAFYNGLAQFHQSKVCGADKRVGEQIARLQYAKTLFSASMERGGQPDLCGAKEWLRRCERDLTDAEKDNDFIYHERIPDVKTLAPLAKAAVAKPTPVGDRMGQTDAAELFGELMPVGVHQAMATYEVRKGEIVNGELGKMKEATNLLNELLASMNLPAALEDTTGNDIPQSLKDKSRAVQEAGGVAELTKLMTDLPELLQRNTEILEECERLLNEEKESDEQLQNQFREKWTRTPSHKLTGTFTANASKYRGIINNAVAADKTVREKLDEHKSFMEALSGGTANMQAVVPSGSGSSAGGAVSPTVKNLKALMDQVDALKAERQVNEAELKVAAPDMKSVFLSAYAKGELNEPAMSVESLGQTFGKLQKQVGENVARQERLVAEVQELHQQFVSERGGCSSARDDGLKKLAAANDAFFELKGNLQEGTKFYNDLTHLLITFQNKVSDFCYARKTEKDELLKDLTSGLASSVAAMNMSTTPTPPAHHAAASASAPAVAAAAAAAPARTAPARPPPPKVEAAAPNPYAGAPPPPANPYAGAPPAANPYAGAPPAHTGAAGAANPYAPPPPHLPYPTAAPMMPMPAGAAPPYPQQAYTPMPGGYNPYGGYAPPPPSAAQYYAPPPQPQQPYPGYPPQPPPAAYPPQQGYPGYPPRP